MSLEPRYEVLSPEGRAGLRVGGSTAPIKSIAGKKIGLFWNGFTNGNLLLEALSRLIAERHPGTSFVKLPSGRGMDWGHYPERSLTDVVREYAIDAAIAGPGC
jgi:hypothetical protein